MTFKLNLAQILAIVIFFYSFSVMAGWIFNIDVLTRILPNEINMKFITALSFFLSAAALWLIDMVIKGKKEIPQIILPAITLSILLIVLTLITGGLLGVQTGISELFVESDITKTVIPGMPALPAVVGFTLFGIASILALFESPKIRQRLLYLGIPIILIGLTTCLGYLLQIPYLYFQFSKLSNPVAPNTGMMLMFLGFGVILSGRGKENANRP